MSTPLETTLIEQAQKNEANQESLRVELGLSEDSPIQATAGFTITNVKSRIAASMSKPNVTGWMFIYKMKSTPDGTSNDTNISDISLLELEISLGLNTISTILNAPLFSVEINPYIHFQHVALNSPNPSNSSDYPSAAAYTGSGYVPSLNLKTSSLSYFSEWTRAAFIRKTDLLLLHDYLEVGINSSDDIFFSGAFLDYDSMQNALLRIEQLNTPGIDNLSRTFTLKAEPISFQHASLLDEHQSPSIPEPETSTEATPPEATTDSSSASIPLSFAFVPCPPYWHAGEEGLKEKAMAVGGYSRANSRSINSLFQDQAQIDDFLARKKIKTSTLSLNLWPIIAGGIVRLFSLFKSRPRAADNTNLRANNNDLT